MRITLAQLGIDIIPFKYRSITYPFCSPNYRSIIRPVIDWAVGSSVEVKLDRYGLARSIAYSSGLHQFQAGEVYDEGVWNQINGLGEERGRLRDILDFGTTRCEYSPRACGLRHQAHSAGWQYDPKATPRVMRY